MKFAISCCARAERKREEIYAARLVEEVERLYWRSERYNRLVLSTTRGAFVPDDGLPIARPGKIVCVGLNHRDRAEASGMDLPERPLLFAKWRSSLGVVIGTRASRGRTPPLYLADGDEVRVEIEGVGSLTDPVRRA